ncbi:Hypothetical predicted protein [Olea europaea subsp. europaea]|uniref:Uncharacterized protein n=1 Tax=Olea europaea subsp. europaea TaxID=158383 RepID=A0A8S0VJS3_OLEEU|nr:Hypothetical predicted protein [Olea europaea subsp. europaea]
MERSLSKILILKLAYNLSSSLLLKNGITPTEERPGNATFEQSPYLREKLCEGVREGSLRFLFVCEVALRAELKSSISRLGSLTVMAASELQNWEIAEQQSLAQRCLVEYPLPSLGLSCNKNQKKGHGDTRICTDVRGEESQTLEELNRSSSGKKSIKTTDRNDPDQDTAVQSSLETIGCPSASNRFASLQTEEDTHEVDEFGEELLQGAEGT